jgi:hypothetical protein
MVRSGFALSFVRYSHDYDRDESVAREAKVGLWAGAFIAPWDWRHRNEATVVLGALGVPVDAQKTLLGAVSSEGAAISRLHDKSKRRPRRMHLSPARRPLVWEDENGCRQAVVLLRDRGCGGRL